MNYSESFTAMLDNKEQGIRLTYSKNCFGTLFSINLGYNAQDTGRWELTSDEASRLVGMLERFIRDKEREEVLTLVGE